MTTTQRYLAGLLCASALCCAPAKAQIFNPTDSTGIITACGSSNTQVLYTSGTSCAGSANLTFDGTNVVVAGAVTVLTSKITGSSSGTITIGGTSGTFNFNLPITVGGAGTVLTSQAGGSTAMTWTTLATSATTDTTNASNISSGTLPAARLPNPTATTLGGIESYAAVSNQWINTISTSGVPSSTQPACGNLSNAAASCSTDATNASNIGSGTLPAGRLPNPSATTLGGIESYVAVSNQWINTISTSGVPSSTQPACGNLSNAAASCSTDATNASNIGSGTLPAGRLPNPSATTLGGVESLAVVSHKWINTISTSGVPAATQPACSDLSDVSASCATDATNASNISTGTLALGRETAGGSNTQVQFNSSNAFSGDSGFTYAGSGSATLTAASNPTVSTLTLTGATALTTSHPVLNATQTWVTVGTTYTALKLNVTDTASATDSLLIDLQVGGTSELNITKGGSITTVGQLLVGSGAVLGWTGRGYFWGRSDGVFMMTDTSQASFGRLEFGGETTSYPALKRSSAIIQVRLADDSADTGIEARSFSVGGATPTLSGTCANPTMAGGNTAGTMTTGTGCAGTTIILTFALTAPTGWACTTTNRTLSTRVMPQTGSSTTTATFTGTTNNSDVLQYSCLAY